MTVPELLEVMNESDSEVPKAVAKVLPTIGAAIEDIVERMMQGGRLIYMGAGTSGRLGVLDAAECGPTFSVTPDEVIAFIAGGNEALRTAVEGAEDDPVAGANDLKSITLTPRDVVVGIAASGRTPSVIPKISLKSGRRATKAPTTNPFTTNAAVTATRALFIFLSY